MNKFELVLLNENKKSGFFLASFAEILLTVFVWVGTMFYLAKTFEVQMPSPEFPDLGIELKFAFFLLICAFLAPLIVLFIFRRFLHNQSAFSIISAGGIFRFRNFIAGFVISALILIIAMVLTDPNAVQTALKRINSYSPKDYSILFAVYFFGFLIQTGFEEVFFRSILVQNIAKTRLPLLLVFLISSMIFAAFHYGPAIRFEVLIGVFIMGASYNYAAWRTQGIEISIGAHFANNLIVGAIIGALDNSKNFENALLSGLVYTVAFVALIELYMKLQPKPNV